MNSFELKATEQWSLPVEGVRGLCVTTADSAIRIAGDETDQIEVCANKKVRASSEAAARAFLEEMRVERRREGDRWVVEAIWPRPRPHGVESAGIAFEIRTPAELTVEARSENGAVEARGVAEARLRTTNGSITASQIRLSLGAQTCNGAVGVNECAGPVEAQTENGRIDVRRAAGEVRAITCNGAIQVEECAGPVEARTENARIELRGVPCTARLQTSNGAIRCEDTGPIDARTSSGEIALRRVLSPVQAKTSDGRIEVELAPGEPPAEAELATRNGAIDLRLPPNTSAHLAAETSNARITLEQPAGRVQNSSPRLETTLGTGEGSLRLHTSNGAIRIRLAE